MRDKTTELVELKRKIERGKEKRSQLQGQRNALMKSLKEEFNVSSLEEAQTKLKKHTAVVKKMEEEQAQAIEQLRSKYGLW